MMHLIKLALMCMAGTALWMATSVTSLFAAQSVDAGQTSALYQDAAPHTIYLPVVAGDHIPPDFIPAADSQLSAGTSRFGWFVIRPGIIVIASGPSTIVANQIIIRGVLRATCGALDLRASVQLSIIGALDNGCDSAQTLPPPLSLSTPSTGAFVLGEPGVTATLHTSGVLNISNATDIPVWEFDVPRGARSATKLPPACFAKTVCADELAFVLVCAHGYFSSSATGANGVDRLISASDALITRTC